MKLFIIETGETKTLTLPCPKTGCCYAAEFIQGRDITTVENEDGDDVQAMTAEAFAWWEKVIAKQAILDQRIEGLVAEHGSEAVYAVVHRIAGYYDLENEADMINSELDSEFGESGILVTQNVLEKATADGYCEVSDGVYISTKAYMLAEQQKWDESDESKDFDFTVADFWLTHDNGQPPVAVSLGDTLYSEE